MYTIVDTRTAKIIILSLRLSNLMTIATNSDRYRRSYSNKVTEIHRVYDSLSVFRR